jgi:FkbM family methyltransferase
MIVGTSVGPIKIRDENDERVVDEVLRRNEYMVWGELEIKKGDVVIDCGAHIGCFTKYASLKEANVIAIEPEYENFALLKENTEGFDNLKIINAVLYNGKKARFLVDSKRSDLHKVDRKGKLVNTIKLDSIVDFFKIKRIDFLKMDIEGAEYEVLKGFKNITKVRQLSIEWHYGSVALSRLIIFLDKKGLTTTYLAGNGQWGKLQMKRL